MAPTPSCGRPLPHRKISGLKSLGLGSFFVPDYLPSETISGEIQKGTGGRGRDRKCHKLSQIVVTFYDEFCDEFYDVLCQRNKETEIVIKCRKLSSTPLCAQCHDALKPPTSTHALMLLNCDSPREFGKLWGVSPKSAWPIRGVHSACACQAAWSSVHEIGPHSSEQAVRFAKEKGMPCRTRICNL